MKSNDGERARVLTSFQDDAGSHCVDVFARADGTFGFEEFRRDHEDGQGWFSLHRFGHLIFAAEDEALAQARSRVAWLTPEPAAGVKPLEFQVRRATERDHDAVESLYRKCRRDAQWLAPGKRAGTSFAQVSAGEAVFVAVGRRGELEGLISVWEREPFVHHLYVRAQSRRKGVAEALLKSMVGRLPFPWRLKCVRANTEALGFYAKRGWREIGSGEGSEGAYLELQLARWPAGIGKSMGPIAATIGESAHE